MLWEILRISQNFMLATRIYFVTSTGKLTNRPKQKHHDAIMNVAGCCFIWSAFQLIIAKPNQSNYCGQSQHTQKAKWANQNTQQLRVTDTKRGKIVFEQLTIGFSFASYWLRKRRMFFQPITEGYTAKQWKWEFLSIVTINRSKYVKYLQ